MGFDSANFTCNHHILVVFYANTILNKPKGAGTPDYYPLYTALTTFYSDYFVGGLWAHMTTIYKCIFLYFAY